MVSMLLQPSASVSTADITLGSVAKLSSAAMIAALSVLDLLRSVMLKSWILHRAHSMSPAVRCRRSLDYPLFDSSFRGPLPCPMFHDPKKSQQLREATP